MKCHTHLPYMGIANDTHGWRTIAELAVAEKISRDDAIAILVWNDRNGCYTDKDCAMERMDPLTHDEALTLLFDTATEL